ncbi:MSMEG_0567/sll0787 family protein [Microbacterium sp. 5K110]|jgi:putative N-acetyltransferase (TIGR04045 family)|uniref:MSMEG_0567/sll0787 family protein n=1 Tax=unclassified Microbacterium TaxID=2609290 RepID=UPI0010FD3653|nr:MSMEG_0567/sll0787 family protein [Microbacterium sp. 5K110]TLF32579.1 AIR synthase [Microbacterium sp. 5K110]
MLDVTVLSGTRTAVPTTWSIVRADAAQAAAYRRIRRDVFVDEQELFRGDDRDAVDDDSRTIVLVAVGSDGTVLGGVRLSPAVAGRDIGWWTGSRLAVARGARRAGGIGPALVREACATALAIGVLRFEATVQRANVDLFRRLGWIEWGTQIVAGVDHARMRWPIDRIAALVAATKTPLGDTIGMFAADGPSALGGAGFIGDDGAPVPGTEVIAACDAILPALLMRDPEWAGWCGVLVNVNDLTAMGALPSGLLNAVAAPTASFARRVLNGLRSAAIAWDVPVLGGHTQMGSAAPALTVTALGRTAHPVPGGGGRPGHELSLTADLRGRWRRGFEGRQWDSTSTSAGTELRAMARSVHDARPEAAKDVSMAGIVGTAAMLAEASGVGATIDVAGIPVPDGAAMGDWLTCFPGFGMLTADAPGRSRMHAGPAHTAAIGRLDSRAGVRLRWPDGVETDAVGSTATGLGPTAATISGARA